MDGRIVLTKASCGAVAFIYEDEVLSEVHPFCNESETGGIYVAVVDNIVENLKAAFLRIEGGEILYYSLDENEGKHIFVKHGNKSTVKKGDWLLVQKTKAATGNKRAQATADISLRGRYAIANCSGRLGISKKITSNEERERLNSIYEKIKNDHSEDFRDSSGVIFRSAITSVLSENVDLIVEDTVNTLKSLNDVIAAGLSSTAGCCIYRREEDPAEYLRDLRFKKTYNKLTVVTDIKDLYDELSNEGFDQSELILHNDKMQSLRALYNIDRNLKVMFGRKIYLPSGGYLIVDLTEALTVIDVNTGKDIKGSDFEEHIVKTNKEAAEMISKVLRVRNLSGIIIVDLINMREASSQERVLSRLKEFISRDHKKCFFVDMTSLGLAELTRQRTGSTYSIEKLLDESK